MVKVSFQYSFCLYITFMDYHFSSDITYCVAPEILPNPFSISVIIRNSPHAQPLYANYKVIHLKLILLSLLSSNVVP